VNRFLGGEFFVTSFHDVLKDSAIEAVIPGSFASHDLSVIPGAAGRDTGYREGAGRELPPRADRSEIPRMEELRHTLVRHGADHALVLGDPARIAGWMCQCGARLKAVGGQLTCPACSRPSPRRGARGREALTASPGAEA
jgi:hypothetical protein